MKYNAALISLFSLLLVSLCLLVHASQATPFTGDSLVLAGTEAGYLTFPGLLTGSVKVRSTYAPDAEGTVEYTEGEDYTVDYTMGAIARTADSRIPDFQDNVLYGQKDFDHGKFPGFGNTAFFVFVDYETKSYHPLVEKNQRAGRLPETARKLKAGEPLKIVAYGDSITAGGDATSVALRFQQRFAQHLREQYPKSDITVENGATGGDTTSQGLNRLEEKVLTRTPDLVLIGFGMNDHNINSIPPEKFAANLKSIVTQIRDRTGAEVILYSAFPPNDDWKYGTHRMDEYADVTARAADDLDCAFADVYTPWTKILERKAPSSILGNNINHPNDFGHWLYYQALVAVPLS